LSQIAASMPASRPNGAPTEARYVRSGIGQLAEGQHLVIGQTICSKEL
jgi:hypothetical protein